MDRFHQIQKHKTKLYAILQDEYRFSCMSTTKWEEVKAILRSFKLSYRTKLITHSTISGWTHAGAYEPQGYIDNHGPVDLLEVEWLEIDPLYQVPHPYVGPTQFVDHADVVEEHIRKINVPFTKEINKYRIWGHIPNGVYPELQQGTRFADPQNGL